MGRGAPHIRRMRPFRFVALLAPALLAGCATQAGFDQRMGALVGLSQADLVRRVGVPDSVFPADGRLFLQYLRLGQQGPATVQPVFGLGVGGFSFSRGVAVGSGFGFGTPAYVWPPPLCTVVFEIVADRVAAFTARGDGCLAVPP